MREELVGVLGEENEALEPEPEPGVKGERGRRAGAQQLEPLSVGARNRGGVGQVSYSAEALAVGLSEVRQQLQRWGRQGEVAR